MLFIRQYIGKGFPVIGTEFINLNFLQLFIKFFYCFSTPAATTLGQYLVCFRTISINKPVFTFLTFTYKAPQLIYLHLLIML